MTSHIFGFKYYMLFVYLGLYFLFLLFIWAFFLIARIHAYKFHDFSENIGFISNVLFFFLLTLTIIGFILIFFSPGVDTGSTVRVIPSNTTSEISY